MQRLQLMLGGEDVAEGGEEGQNNMDIGETASLPEEEDEEDPLQDEDQDEEDMEEDVSDNEKPRGEWVFGEV